MKSKIKFSLFLLVIIINPSTLPTASSVPITSPNFSTLPMALSAPLESVPGKRTIFAQDLVHTAFKPIGKTPLQTENIPVTAFFRYQYDNLAAYFGVVLEELKQRKSISHDTESLKVFATNRKQTLKEYQQDSVFSVVDSEDNNEQSHDKFAKIKFIEASHIVKKPENIVTVEIDPFERDNFQKDLKHFEAYVRDQLQKNLTHNIQRLLNSKFNMAWADARFLYTMVNYLRESPTAEKLFLFSVSKQEVFEEINKKAALLGLENMILESADYGKLQVTTTSNSKGINFTFEVPCMKPNPIMALYSYKPLPIVINKNVTNDIQAALYIESQEANVIAIGQDNTTFMVLNYNELHCSNEFNGVKVCKGLTELHNNLTDSCLGALFMQTTNKLDCYASLKYGSFQWTQWTLETTLITSFLQKDRTFTLTVLIKMTIM
jgi:hypothetical protein